MQREGKLTTLDLILCGISASWEVASLWSVTLPHHTTSKDYTAPTASQDLLKKTNFQKVENMIDDEYTDLIQLHAAHASIVFTQRYQMEYLQTELILGLLAA